MSPHKLAVAERAHASLGGSTALQWSNCAGWAFFSDNTPAQASSDAMEYGTAGHSVAERVLKAHLHERLHGSHPYTFTDLTDPQLWEWAQIYKRYIWEKVLNQSITGKRFGIEERVVIHPDYMFGFIDFWAVFTTERARRRGAVADYKTGQYSVPVEKNAQLAFYAVALRMKERSEGRDLDEVHASIIQPPLGEGNDYKETLFTAKQLDIWEKRFFKQAHQIFVEKKPVFKVGQWCELCRFRGQCRAYGKTLEAKSGLAVVDIEQRRLPAPESLPDEVIYKFIKFGPDIEDYLKEVRKVAKQRYIDGNAVPGTKLVEGRSNRKWVDETVAAVGEYLHSNGVENPVVQDLIGVPDAERELTKLHGKARAKEILAAVVTKPSGALTLVLDEDPRQPVLSGVDLLKALPSS